jgi:hypothetical protein
MDHPYLPNLVSSDWLNYTITYTLTTDETTQNAIEFNYSNDGFPIVKHPKRQETKYTHDAVGWTDFNAKAKWWKLQVFDQTGTRICPPRPAEWERVNSDGRSSLRCSPVLTDHQGNENKYITLELDYVLSGDPAEKGTNHLTLGHVLRLVPAE